MPDVTLCCIYTCLMDMSVLSCGALQPSVFTSRSAELVRWSPSLSSGQEPSRRGAKDAGCKLQSMSVKDMRAVSCIHLRMRL